MNIFSQLKIYDTNWKLVSERPFSDEEKSLIQEAYIRPSNYGLSVCFVLKSGGMSFIPLSDKSTCSAGEQIDVDKVIIQELTRDGKNINRILI